jgi:hypothetical protein
MQNPRLLELNGMCGGVAPGRLPILVGDAVDRCPTAMGMQDPEVLRAANALARAGIDPKGNPGVVEGLLGDDVGLTLPPRWRAMWKLSRVWRAAFLAGAE